MDASPPSRCGPFSSEGVDAVIDDHIAGGERPSGQAREREEKIIETVKEYSALVIFLTVVIIQLRERDTTMRQAAKTSRRTSRFRLHQLTRHVATGYDVGSCQ